MWPPPRCGVACRILADEEAESQAARLRACNVPPEAASGPGAAAPGAGPLVAFLACWAEHATDTRGPFQMRLCAAVLASLLAGKIPEVSQAQVRARSPPASFAHLVHSSLRQMHSHNHRLIS